MEFKYGAKKQTNFEKTKEIARKNLFYQIFLCFIYRFDE